MGASLNLLLLVAAVAAFVFVPGCYPTGQQQEQPQQYVIEDYVAEETEAKGDLMSDALGSVKWFGHASFMFTDKASGNRIYYVDPFEFKSDGKEKADVIFITHAHYDHCDPDSVKKILKPETVIVVPGGCKEKLKVNAEFIDAVPNKEYDVKGFKFRTVPAYNVKPDRLQYHPKSNSWVGYIFSLNNQTIYHAGDTDFIPEMKQLGKINVAMLPIGGTYTMDADEAIVAANTIAADITVPMHYRRLLGSNYKSAEEKFKAGVTKSKVVILEQVA
jgi:L-ascorbate metabolism protein UlaG (beta-lactamase superfamily)